MSNILAPTVPLGSLYQSIKLSVFHRVRLIQPLFKIIIVCCVRAFCQDVRNVKLLQRVWSVTLLLIYIIVLVLVTVPRSIINSQPPIMEYVWQYVNQVIMLWKALWHVFKFALKDTRISHKSVAIWQLAYVSKHALPELFSTVQITLVYIVIQD